MLEEETLKMMKKDMLLVFRRELLFYVDLVDRNYHDEIKEEQLDYIKELDRQLKVINDQLLEWE